ncbi:GWxTD domain-containing protein [bacterium]|nr:GWxTD domain-containing protein [bacterium]
MLVRYIAIALLFLAQLGFAAEPIKWSDLQKNIDTWIEGPPSLIITSDEKDVWKRLKTPEEKMQFIKIFWARRDPILRTRENEYKQKFYERVEYANQTYAEKNGAGWKSARGRTYIMFGAPGRVDKQTFPGSSRPAELWVYDKTPSDRIPPNEAMLFVYRDFKYVLYPPNPQPGDTIGEQQQALDANFKYQDIPSVVQAAFVDVSKANIIDESKDYRDLISSVKSTEKFGLNQIEFEVRPLKTDQYEIVLKPETAPVYDAGEEMFAEFFFKQELKKGDQLIAANQHTASFKWDQTKFAELKEIAVTLPSIEVPPGQYDLYITVGDRISNVTETRKVPVSK